MCSLSNGLLLVSVTFCSLAVIVGRGCRFEQIGSEAGCYRARTTFAHHLQERPDIRTTYTRSMDEVRYVAVISNLSQIGTSPSSMNPSIN